jgi:hypothetical protein
MALMERERDGHVEDEKAQRVFRGDLLRKTERQLCAQVCFDLSSITLKTVGETGRKGERQRGPGSADSELEVGAAL